MSSTKEKTVKVKKDKSSKKRKAEDLVETSLEPEAIEADSSPESAPEDGSASPSGATDHPSKKRKSSLASEIEVDITAPEPPSKKALRRLKKGKPLPPSKSGADSDAEPETTTDGVTVPAKKEEEKRSPHGIWIGNLPWSVTKDMLRKFFVENSDIEDDIITRIHMPSPDDGKPANRVPTSTPAWKKQHNKGFAYVDFSTADAVEEAVGLSEELLHGRRVLIKNNKSFEGRPMKTPEQAKAEGKEPSKRIFVGNLRFDATEENVKEHFEQCGPIDNIMIATFEDSGKCKGYGWITFQNLESAEAAVRGWVQVEEKDDEASSNSDSDSTSESESDSDSGSDANSESDAESTTSPKPIKAPPIPSKKAPIRKHYIDKIQMRPIRREFAEPPQVRYKKRYGKDGTKNKQNGGGGGEGESGGDAERVRKPRPDREEKKPVEYAPLGTSYAPRLTGAIRKPEGKKVVF